MLRFQRPPDVVFQAILRESMDCSIGFVEALMDKKKKSSVQRTVSALDYNALYLIVRDRVPSLNKFIEQIDSFMV